jgi:hypothetical protein
MCVRSSSLIARANLSVRFSPLPLSFSPGGSTRETREARGRETHRLALCDCERRKRDTVQRGCNARAGARPDLPGAPARATRRARKRG